jgi:hypothetical protein
MLHHLLKMDMTLDKVCWLSFHPCGVFGLAKVTWAIRHIGQWRTTQKAIASVGEGHETLLEILAVML